MTAVFVLLVAFQLKHFVADYPLQTPYMLKKFMGGWDWVKPLAAHAGVHALFTLFIVHTAHYFLPQVTFIMSLGLAALDFVVHFTMDRIKASPKMLGKYKAMSADDVKACTVIIRDAEKPRAHPEIVTAARGFRRNLRGNTYFWWALGLDQMVHHLTHYAIIYLLVCF